MDEFTPLCASCTHLIKWRYFYGFDDYCTRAGEGKRKKPLKHPEKCKYYSPANSSSETPNNSEMHHVSDTSNE